MGPKADGFNLAEIRESALGSLGGGQPRSIRKRGYHRALKRGESWALDKQTYETVIKDLHINFYSSLICAPNSLLGLSEWLPDIEDKPSQKSFWTRIKELFK